MKEQVPQAVKLLDLTSVGAAPQDRATITQLGSVTTIDRRVFGLGSPPWGIGVDLPTHSVRGGEADPEFADVLRSDAEDERQ